MAIDGEDGLARGLSNHGAPAVRMPLPERRTGRQPLPGLAARLGHGLTAAGTGYAEHRPAAFAHNSFAYSDPGLGGTTGVEGDGIATLGDGTTRRLAFHVGALEIAADGRP